MSASFWFHHLDPMDDISRIIIFGSLFYYVYYVEANGGFSNTANLYANVPKNWIYARYGVAQYIYNLVHWIYGDRMKMIKLISILQRCVYVSWICIICGFGSNYIYILQTFLYFILLSIRLSIIGLNHKFYCLLYLFFASCFSVKHDKLSIDYYIFPSNQAQDNNFNINSTGFGMKLALIFLVYTLFAGGISKIINNFDGTSLYCYIYRFQIAPPRNKYVFKFFKNKQYLFPFMATYSTIFELLSILTLFPNFSTTYFQRFLWTSHFISFHLIIRMIMRPNYIPQCICYLVFFTNIFKQIETENQSEIGTAKESEGLGYVLFGNAVIVILCCLLWKRIEYYPFTVIPMYSMNRAFALKQKWIDLDQFEALCAEKMSARFPGNDGCYGWSQKWFRLELVIYRNNDTRLYNLIEWLNWMKFLKKRRFFGLDNRRLFDMVFSMKDEILQLGDNDRTGDMIKIYGNYNDKCTLVTDATRAYILGLVELLQKYGVIDGSTEHDISLGLIQQSNYWKDDKAHNVSCRESFGISEEIYQAKYKRF